MESSEKVGWATFLLVFFGFIGILNPLAPIGWGPIYSYYEFGGGVQVVHQTFSIETLNSTVISVNVPTFAPTFIGVDSLISWIRISAGYGYNVQELSVWYVVGNETFAERRIVASPSYLPSLTIEFSPAIKLSQIKEVRGAVWGIGSLWFGWCGVVYFIWLFVSYYIAEGAMILSEKVHWYRYRRREAKQKDVSVEQKLKEKDFVLNEYREDLAHLNERFDLLRQQQADLQRELKIEKAHNRELQNKLSTLGQKVREHRFCEYCGATINEGVVDAREETS